MGFFDSILPEDTNTRGNVLDAVQAIGMGMLQGDRDHFFGTNMAQNLAAIQAGNRSGMSRQALKAVLMQRGFSDAEAEKLSASEAAAKLAIQGKEDEGFGNLVKGYYGGGPASNLGMGATPPAPGGPAAGASLNGGGLTPPTGTGAEIQNKFVGALKDGGLTNPYGLAAVAAHVQHESGFSPDKLVGSWSDPSESGQAGQSGGALSWRNERLQAMRAATAGAKDPVTAQAQFTLSEDPAVTAALQNAKSPEEANDIMARSQRFAGYDRPGGGEYARRLATTQAYANRFGQKPTQVADATGTAPVSPVTRSDLPSVMPNGVSGQNPNRPVQFADDENQTQVLEGRMGMYPRNVYGITPGAPKVADGAADMPAPGAQPAEFRIPPGPGGQGGPAYAPDSTTARAVAVRQSAAAAADQEKVKQGLAVIAMSGRYGERGKGLAESIKLQIQPLLKNMEDTDAQKLIKGAGLDGTPEGRDLLLNSITGNAQTSLQKEYGSYRNQEISEGRVPLSQFDFDLKLRREAKADINIRNDAEKKEEVGRAESVTKFLGGIADSAPATAKRAASLDQLGRLISRTATAQGTTLRAQLDGIGKELGLSTGELKTKTDAINAIVNNLAPQMREPGTGTVSDADLRGFLAALPNLSATPEGNQLILGGLKRATDVDRERTKIAAQWQAGKISASDARSKIADIDERSIYASDAERSLVSGLNPIPENKAKPGWRVLGVE